MVGRAPGLPVELRADAVGEDHGAVRENPVALRDEVRLGGREHDHPRRGPEHASQDPPLVGQEEAPETTRGITVQVKMREVRPAADEAGKPDHLRHVRLGDVDMDQAATGQPEQMERQGRHEGHVLNLEGEQPADGQVPPALHAGSRGCPRPRREDLDRAALRKPFGKGLGDDLHPTEVRREVRNDLDDELPLVSTRFRTGCGSVPTGVGSGPSTRPGHRTTQFRPPGLRTSR